MVDKGIMGVGEGGWVKVRAKKKYYNFVIWGKGNDLAEITIST